jgi:hypothetical protein
MMSLNDPAGRPNGDVGVMRAHVAGGVLEVVGGPLTWRLVAGPQRRSSPRGEESDAPRHLKLYGLGRFPVWSHQRTAGGLCWDRLTVTRATAARLLGLLRDDGWEAQSGPAALYDLWGEGGRLTERSLVDPDDRPAVEGPGP